MDPPGPSLQVLHTYQCKIWRLSLMTYRLAQGYTSEVAGSKRAPANRIRRRRVLRPSLLLGATAFTRRNTAYSKHLRARRGQQERSGENARGPVNGAVVEGNVEDLLVLVDPEVVRTGFGNLIARHLDRLVPVVRLEETDPAACVGGLAAATDHRPLRHRRPKP